MQETGVWSLGQGDPQEREWQSTPVFLPRESHGQRSLVGFRLWDHRESDMTEQLTLLLLCGATHVGYKNTHFHNCPRIYLFQDLNFFAQLLVTVQCSFTALCRTPLDIFADRSNGHQLTQFLLENVLTSYSLLKDVFLIAWLFLWALHIYWLIAFWLPMFLMRNMFTTLGEALICDKLLLSYCFQDSLFTFGFWNLIIMCLGMSLWGHLTWSLLSCLDIYIRVFHQVSEAFSPFVQILSLSSSATTVVCVGPLSVSCRALSLCFSSILFCLFPIQKLVIPLSYHLAQRFFFSQRIIAQICLDSFVSVILHISSSEFLFGFFLAFLAPCWHFHFV